VRHIGLLASLFLLGSAAGASPNLEIGKVGNVGGTWKAVTLSQNYFDMVVVATPNYDETAPPGVVRLRNASGAGFEIRIDPAGGAQPTGVDVYYLVAEAGVFDAG